MTVPANQTWTTSVGYAREPNTDMDLNKVRVITKLKVTCISNVNSARALNPILQLSDSKDPTPTEESYKTRIDAFRLNPGGYQGFNIFKITKDQWNRGDTTAKFESLLTNESLFKAGQFHHSEFPYEIDNISWVLKKTEDLLLWPRFTFFNSLNADFVVTPTLLQAVSVRLPYEYKLDLNYFDI